MDLNICQLSALEVFAVVAIRVNRLALDSLGAFAGLFAFFVAIRFLSVPIGVRDYRFAINRQCAISASCFHPFLAFLNTVQAMCSMSHNVLGSAWADNPLIVGNSSFAHSLPNSWRMASVCSV